MENSKLYKALVMGGAMMMLGACGSPQEKNMTPEPKEEAKESSATATTRPAAKGKPTFCIQNKPEHCEDGKPKSGISCCWGTSC